MSDVAAGYGRYLRAADNGGWAQMFTPGAAGHALMVCWLQVDADSEGINPQNPDREVIRDLLDGMPAVGQRPKVIPWLLPAVVTWRSLVDEDGLLLEPFRTDILERLDERPRHPDRLCYPPVGITQAVFLDGDRSLVYEENMLSTPGQYWGAYELDDGSMLIGIAAPWQLVPIKAADAQVIQNFMFDRMEAWQTWLMGVNPSSGDGSFIDADYEDLWVEANGHLPDGVEPSDEYATDLWEKAIEGSHYGSDTCSYTLGEQNCSCGRPATYVQQWDALMHGDLQAEDFLPPAYHRLWSYALQRYAVGFRAVNEHAEQGDAWSSFCWQRLSPFLDLPSLDLLLRRHWEPSTRSVTELAC